MTEDKKKWVENQKWLRNSSPHSFPSTHLLIIRRYHLWTAAFLSYPGPTMLQRASRAATQVLPHICDHFSFHARFRAHVVSPKSNSNLMWNNSLHVFVFALLCHLEGRPAAPLKSPKNRARGMAASAWGMWFEGCDDRAAFLSGNICSLCAPGTSNPSIRDLFQCSSKYLCFQELPLKMHPLTGRSNTFNICQLPLTWLIN